MSTGICRSLASRNFSGSNLSHPSTITTMKTYAEWAVNGTSSLMFVVALMGNLAALLVMFLPRPSIRLTKSRYLANLAIADLLRTCFIPFTIIARIKRNFIFGKFICKALPIVQGLSVSVAVFTHICIGVERYLAICHPLLLLNLQSMPCASLVNTVVLVLVWIFGFLTAWPNFYMYNLCILPRRQHFKCEKFPPEYFDERLYIISLDALYFGIPLLTMAILYTLIIMEMFRRNAATTMRSFQSHILPLHDHIIAHPICSGSLNSNRSLTSPKTRIICDASTDHNQHQSSPLSSPESVQSRNHFDFEACSSSKRHALSPISIHPADRQRRKALKVLVFLLIEFFVCWAPLYAYHTIGTFNRHFYRSIPPLFVDIILLLSFASASCNPITYYFMSERYREALCAILASICRRKKHSSISAGQYGNSAGVLRAEMGRRFDSAPRRDIETTAL